MDKKNSNELAVREASALTTSMVNSGEIMQIIEHVHAVIKDAMTEGIDNDYGIIPGTKKKTLLKPGSEKILLAFSLTGVARTPSISDMPDGHREVTIETEIIHMGTGAVLAIGLGSCSTMEGKYRYRNADIVCPECSAAAIIKGKADFGGGWLCFAKKGGCGKKWTDAESPFKGAMNSKTEHDNPADYYNTVLKMASKRSMVDGVIRATASSAMFSQDEEDDIDRDGGDPVDKKKKTDTVKGKGKTEETTVMASPDQLKAIHTICTENKVSKELRLAFINDVLGSKVVIKSAKDLSMDHASKVIDALVLKFAPKKENKTETTNGVGMLVDCPNGVNDGIANTEKHCPRCDAREGCPAL